MSDSTERQQTSPGPGRHGFAVEVVWTGNTGAGTSSYRSYERTHEVRAEGKNAIEASADPVFRGEPDRYNPEELLVASLSQCHMLWYLHLAAEHGVVVVGYHDRPHGTLTENADYSGQFREVVLSPEVAVEDLASVDAAEALHERAHELCYIAKSVNFPVRLSPTIRVGN
ncbi:OsmC family protein [Saccharopolyspora sp. MS10]|uniref:OsmC family protein n=1 Tax=Saccharopolyspora sp. MS10 TaxID=3385973 RepID=UPI0039A38867